MSESSAASSSDPIVAHAGRYYRNARYVICAMVLGAGLWFAYDGFVNWPRELDKFNSETPEQQAASHKPHGEFDIHLQQRLAMVLIPLAPILLCFFLYRSRGVYRFADATLHVPGHPPIPIDSIVGIDMSKWKRKGIAYVDYKAGTGSATRRLTLDDFVYEQAPTDQIVKLLDSRFNSEEETDEDSPTSGDADASAI